jgi:hypothetical protein
MRAEQLTLLYTSEVVRDEDLFCIISNHVIIVHQLPVRAALQSLSLEKPQEAAQVILVAYNLWMWFKFTWGEHLDVFACIQMKETHGTAGRKLVVRRSVGGHSISLACDRLPERCTNGNGMENIVQATSVPTIAEHTLCNSSFPTHLEDQLLMP